MADPFPDADGDATTGPATWRRPWSREFWRRLVTTGLTPSSIGLALGIGAAVGVAPLPGLQMVTVVLLCWRLRLNSPVALMASNISLGPLLVMWAAVSASIGRWLRLGVLPWRSYDSFMHDFHAAPPGRAGVMQVVGQCVADWLLGSLVLIPAIGGTVGVSGYLIARAVVQARRRRERARAQER